MSCHKKQLTWRIVSILLVGCLTTFSATSVHAQSWLEQVGYNKLSAEYGIENLETGAGISLSMAEADRLADPALFQYMPNDASFDESQTIVDGSGLNNSGFSSHATSMASRFFGPASIADGGTGATVFEANDFINRVLGTPTGLDPIAQGFKVQSHSWIGNFGNEPAEVAAAVNTLQRLDFVINRDEMSVAVGLNNNSNNSHPQLLGQSYNAIAVGRTDGDHSRGTTSVYGTGRVKPDIVNAESSTSSATARASSVLAMLHEKAVNEGNADASRAVVMKSIVMAGATKHEFASWDRTTTRPLDEVFGAGELNIYNSYKILEAGETDGSLVVPPGATIDVAGYDYGETLDVADSMYYNIEIGENERWDDVSLMLNWNIDVIDNDLGAAFDPSTILADFSMRLYDSTGAPLDTLLDSSLSTVDNVEHIFAEELTTGLYTIEITTDTTHDFAFSWYATSIPEPNSTILLLAASSLIALRRRRTGK